MTKTDLKEPQLCKFREKDYTNSYELFHTEEGINIKGQFN